MHGSKYVHKKNKEVIERFNYKMPNGLSPSGPNFERTSCRGSYGNFFSNLDNWQCIDSLVTCYKFISNYNIVLKLAKKWPNWNLLRKTENHRDIFSKDRIQKAEI